MSKDLYQPLQDGFLLSGAMAQPSSEEILQNQPQPNSVNINDDLMQAYLSSRQEEIKSDSDRRQSSNTQQINLVPQDQQYSDVVDLRSDDEAEIQREFDQEYNEAMNGVSEASNLIERVQDHIPQEVDEDQERNGYIDFLRKYVEFMRRRGISFDQQLKLLIQLATTGYQVYLHWKERKMKSQPKMTMSNTTNKEFYEWSQNQRVPKQCRRNYYTDSNGILRSIVICESYGSQRIYHDV